jgi:electron transport complex protein RnfC
VPTVYPIGGQNQLIKELTGIEMPANAHAIDIGLLMMNVQTFGAIYQAIQFGNPLVRRFVTVSGNNIKEPQNVDALIGTPFNELIALAQLKTSHTPPVIMGGPMMGIHVKDTQVPVIKTTNCILVNLEESPLEVLPCIRCGECMDACPINLLPQQMYWHSRSEEYDKVEKLNVFDCIECGCCSFVCPSNIPLVQYYRHSKSAIKQLKQDSEDAQLAKQRHEFKLARIAQEKADKEARMKAKKAAVKKQAAEKTTDASTDQSKPKTGAGAAAAAAAKAAAARKAAAQNKSVSKEEQPSVTGAPLSARDKAIAVAKKRTTERKAPKVTEAQQSDKESTVS